MNEGKEMEGTTVASLKSCRGRAFSSSSSTMTSSPETLDIQHACGAFVNFLIPIHVRRPNHHCTTAQRMPRPSHLNCDRAIGSAQALPTSAASRRADYATMQRREASKSKSKPPPRRRRRCLSPKASVVGHADMQCYVMPAAAYFRN
jgi:hypothetical protein